MAVVAKNAAVLEKFERGASKTTLAGGGLSRSGGGGGGSGSSRGDVYNAAPTVETAIKRGMKEVAGVCVSICVSICVCQYLCFCTSKASKLRTLEVAAAGAARCLLDEDEYVRRTRYSVYSLYWYKKLQNYKNTNTGTHLFQYTSTNTDGFVQSTAVLSLLAVLVQEFPYGHTPFFLVQKYKY